MEKEEDLITKFNFVEEYKNEKKEVVKVNLYYRLVLKILDYFVCYARIRGKGRKAKKQKGNPEKIVLNKMTDFYGYFKFDPTRSIFLLFRSFTSFISKTNHLIPRGVSNLNLNGQPLFKSKHFFRHFSPRFLNAGMDIELLSHLKSGELKSPFPQLETLIFSFSEKQRIMDPQETSQYLPTFLSLFEGLKKLELFNFGNITLNFDDIKPPFRKLEEFRFSHSRSQAFLHFWPPPSNFISTSFAKSFPVIKRLNFSNVDFDEDFSLELSKLEHLESIDYNATTSEFLSLQFMNNPNLKSVDLRLRMPNINDLWYGTFFSQEELDAEKTKRVSLPIQYSSKTIKEIRIHSRGQKPRAYLNQLVKSIFQNFAGCKYLGLFIASLKPSLFRKVLDEKRWCFGSDIVIEVPDIFGWEGSRDLISSGIMEEFRKSGRMKNYRKSSSCRFTIDRDFGDIE